ncbi:holin [Pectobacterium bacteriophage PM2]|uniref:Holin n=1 Tax=Pectobacterium bacteriophage PM2 TaxID=1429794 RepID=A0A0A0Q0S1_9CAUD|nr:holin [Pectobacterium bacteriophage PM2]AHY25236.1 holin lysis mediator [Pectobacterium bacteriophage PM2]
MSTPSVSVIDLVFGVLDRLFKDNSGRVPFSRIFSVILLFFMGVFWYKGEELLNIYKSSQYEAYAEIIRKEKDVNFDKTAKEQVQIVHVSSGADFTAVYAFRPINSNFFVDMVAYQGILPPTVNELNLGGFPIDKTSEEYINHVNGEYFNSVSESIFLPTKKKTDFNFMFSCPYFNLSNTYAGSIGLYWYTSAPKYGQDRLQAICGQAGRMIGRTR